MMVSLSALVRSLCLFERGFLRLALIQGLKLPLRRNPDLPQTVQARLDVRLSVKGWWDTLDSVQSATGDDGTA